MGAPLTQLNETEVLEGHAPTPPSYWTIDVEEPGDQQRHPGLMAAHACLMSVAFFGALPAGRILAIESEAAHDSSATSQGSRSGASSTRGTAPPLVYSGHPRSWELRAARRTAK
jgi:hypothetical protein